jgi:hypothetical protein
MMVQETTQVGKKATMAMGEYSEKRNDLNPTHQCYSKKKGGREAVDLDM